MTGEFSVDKKLIKSFYKKGLISVIKVLFIIWLIVVISILSNYEGLDDLYIIAGITALMAIYVGACMANTFPGYVENTVIILERDKIIRKGEGMTTAEISFDKLGKIAHLPNGVAIVEKGIGAYFTYYTTRERLRYRSNIIFIPSMIENLEEITIYIKNIKSQQKAMKRRL